MKMVHLALCALLPAATTQAASRPHTWDAPKSCDACEAWNATRAPFRVFGDTYYVGVAGLSAALIASDDGLILLDGGLPQSAPLIEASLRQLGFRIEDVRLIVNSHAHYDHAGGLAALQRASGATVAASAAGAAALEHGEPGADDPQHAFGRAANAFPPLAHVRVVHDGETLRVGRLALTAHATPGHTPGGTTWTWRSCEGERCLDVVYADSLTPVAAPDFRFTASGAPASTEAVLRRSIAHVSALPCDILLTVHPGFAGLDEKLRRRDEQPGTNPFVDPQACRAYAADAARRLDERVAEERQEATPAR